MPIVVPGSSYPAYTVDKVRADVRARGWDTDTSEEQLAILNSILREIYGEREWGFLERTSTHTLQIGNTNLFAVNAAPSDFRYQSGRHLHVTHPTDVEQRWELEQIGADEYRDDRDRLELTKPGNRGVPATWSQVDDLIRVHPAPDMAYVVELTYQRVPPDLQSGSDVIPIPAPYQDVVTAGVLAELALRERDYASADRWAQVYQRRHAELVRRDPNRYRRDRQSVRRTGVHDAFTDVERGWY